MDTTDEKLSQYANAVSDARLRALVCDSQKPLTSAVYAAGLSRYTTGATPDDIVKLTQILDARYGSTSGGVYNLHKIDVAAAPALATLIPGLTTLDGTLAEQLVARYDAAVAESRAAIADYYVPLCDDMAEAVVSSCQGLAGDAVVKAAAAAVVAFGGRSGRTATIVVRLWPDSVSLYAWIEFCGQYVPTEGHTKMLVDLVVDKSHAAAARLLTTKWRRFQTWGEAYNFAPAGSDQLFKVVVGRPGSYCDVWFAPPTAAGRAEFAALLTSIVPELASALTDRVVERIFVARQMQFVINTERFASIFEFIGRYVAVSLEAVDAVVAARGVIEDRR